MNKANVAYHESEMMRAGRQVPHHWNQDFRERISKVSPEMAAKLQARIARLERYEKRLDQYIHVRFIWSLKTGKRTVADLQRTTMDSWYAGKGNGCHTAKIEHKSGVVFFFVSDIECDVFPALVTPENLPRLASAWLGL